MLELAKRTTFANLDLVPSKPELAGAAVELARHENGDRYLVDALEAARAAYSFVFLDCPPSLGPLTVNALAASDRVLVPVQAEYYALEGLAQLTRSIDLVRRRLNPRLVLGGVLLTMVDGRTRLSADVATEVRRHFGDLVFKTVVPRSVRLAEAPSYGLPAIAYDRRSTGRRGLLEGGDGACRASLIPSGAGSAAASRCSSAAPTRPSSRTSPSRRSTATRTSRGAASSPRRRPGSPSR